jgi:hypothetical protein
LPFWAEMVVLAPEGSTTVRSGAGRNTGCANTADADRRTIGHNLDMLSVYHPPGLC